MKFPDDIDKKILVRIQGDLPLEKRPFDAWAREIGLEPREFIDRINALKLQGIVREMKAVLRHRAAGFSAGAMVVWAVPDDMIEDTGAEIAGMSAVSHCYVRPGFGEYNLFSMIHGKTRNEVEDIITGIASSLRISRHKVYWSTQELKKSSMEYIREGQ